MIAVAGLNSAIDKLLDVDALTAGEVIRAREVRAWPGGKGVHVATCAAVLDQPVRLTGLIDDAHREWFAAWLRARGVDFHAVDTPTPIRTCLALREPDGRVTEILEPGAAIDSDVCDAAFHTSLNVCRKASLAILTGSLPPGLSGDTYARIVASLPDTRVLVDASGELLRQAIGARPFAVKPNRKEAEALTGAHIGSPAAAVAAARALVQSGVQLAVISLGAEGAVACWGDRAWHVVAPPVEAVNAVGAGDCLLGGIAAALARGDSMEDAVRLGVAAGTAKVVSPDTGEVRRADIDRVWRAVRIQPLS
jgi:1-phosphofructokinase family hexose kinase